MTYEQAIAIPCVRRALASEHGAAFELELRQWLRDKAVRKATK